LIPRASHVATPVRQTHEIGQRSGCVASQATILLLRTGMIA
jgi:hypothetical protein